eukprot:CAMPEP_0170629808 /NCGR_PEP_ID=MMETSP0224-20130122/33574_1 /TAXON_ID=285029 /ORGANISM="Togula jolla, Strain CCCM 725" /LENGTH=39 /DNA_ID= /DNA_START= /DNA_END= /DNA_ORIENTATION=
MEVIQKKRLQLPGCRRLAGGPDVWDNIITARNARTRVEA